MKRPSAADLRTEFFKRLNQVSDQVTGLGSRARFHCPVCEKNTVLTPAITPTGIRRWARCARCGALERHRLQAWTVKTHVLPHWEGRKPRVLHIAPESSIRNLLEPISGSYITGDFSLPGMDMRIDLRAVDLPDGSFDIVYASHVLEHIDRDRDALAEISRLLSPGGLAVLPVPLIGEHTVEYPEPNPVEAYHVRAPGYEFYDRYEEHFARVERISSADAPVEAQCYVFEDRSGWPTRSMPHRIPSPGRFHPDVVPLCWK